ncbi:uncharacterized protein TRAVEDRAFT_22242 [Trametes versicolor FP-101664 SS1]|uniref:uncharacterized protein n=1 Tax=Trametes versicolor (strain FP-101664) TaxID=717944 RepID=UPI000462251C|nr:uncharacterized protein TRAVEDRAFT_22242 [Trametes versicolor FP-101664 SS1]EIW55804.1 hypothetical protein TRAVEDRAFT_22242 [Trametes versicolor FP-101664 SS1]
MDPSTFVEHRCFLLCETFELILDWLPLSQRERTLASLAATCKALNQASTPALWHSLDSLRPLLKLLPSNSWNKRLVDCVEPVDWTRFKYYARYVRRLNWDHPSDMYAYPLHELLDHHLPANPLLPQLRTLVFHDSYPYFTLVRFFLTPTLERLKIKAHAIYEPDVVSLMNEVVANHKNLRYLSLDLRRDDGSVLRGGFVFSRRLAAPTDAEASALMSLFRALPDLQVYHGLLNMSAARTEALAALPRLATVHIDITRAEVKTVAAAARLRVRDPYAGLWFASLTSLSLSLDRLDVDTETFLGAIQSPGLQKLMIDFEEQPAAAELRNRLAVTARARGVLRWLSALRISAGWGGEDVRPGE